MTWKQEFGKPYEVPEEIDALVASGELLDLSWHNDISPSFGRMRDCDANGEWFDAPRLFVDHVEDVLREHGRGSSRFSVFDSEWNDLYYGDDLAEALVALRGAK